MPLPNTELFDTLSIRYPDRTSLLDHRNPFELLIATILAAQCTDRQVNIVTPELFGKWPTPRDLAAADLAEIESVIHSTGFYRNKAINIQKCAAMLETLHDSTVPSDLKALVALPGVGRKTANVVRSTAFGVSAVVVDTHVMRIAGRLGWTSSKNPDQVEKTLMELFDESKWSRIAPVLIRFGRETCQAKRPLCPGCPILENCPFPDKTTG